MKTLPSKKGCFTKIEEISLTAQMAPIFVFIDYLQFQWSVYRVCDFQSEFVSQYILCRINIYISTERIRTEEKRKPSEMTEQFCDWF